MPRLLARPANEETVRLLGLSGQFNSLFSRERKDRQKAWTKTKNRRFLSDEFRRKALQVLLVGHSMHSVAER